MSSDVTFTPMLELHLPCPEGWRWVGEEEWREEPRRPCPGR